MKLIRFILILGVTMFVAQRSTGQQLEEVVVESFSMKKDVLNTVITPAGYEESQENYPVVYLLHGAGGDHTQWLHTEPDLQKYADQNGIIIVCPDGGSTSWYFDSPVDPTMKYETYISGELVNYMDSSYRTIPGKEGRAISGLSMGGHGALYLGIRHPDIYGAAGSTSGGVDIRPFPKGWDIALRLGKLRKHPGNWERNTVINLVDSLRDNELRLIFDCGVDDFFYEVNENLHDKLLALDISHDYTSRPGNHDQGYWAIALKYHFLFFSEFFKTGQKN